MSATDGNIPAPVKPGYKTTEFWFSFVAAIGGFLMASGMISAGSTAERIIGGALAVLATLGYTAARANTKVNS